MMAWKTPTTARPGTDSNGTVHDSYAQGSGARAKSEPRMASSEGGTHTRACTNAPQRQTHNTRGDFACFLSQGSSHPLMCIVGTHHSRRRRKPLQLDRGILAKHCWHQSGADYTGSLNLSHKGPGQRPHHGTKGLADEKMFPCRNHSGTASPSGATASARSPQTRTPLRLRRVLLPKAGELGLERMGQQL